MANHIHRGIYEMKEFLNKVKYIMKQSVWLFIQVVFITNLFLALIEVLF